MGNFTATMVFSIRGFDKIYVGIDAQELACILLRMPCQLLRGNASEPVIPANAGIQFLAQCELLGKCSLVFDELSEIASRA